MNPSPDRYVQVLVWNGVPVRMHLSVLVLVALDLLGGLRTLGTPTVRGRGPALERMSLGHGSEIP